jgi:hypothetical protein
VTGAPRVPAREVGNLSTLGTLADEAFLAVRHAAKYSDTADDREALKRARAIFSALATRERPRTTPAGRLKRMAAVEAAVALLDETDEDTVDAVDIDGLIAALDRTLAGDRQDQDLKLLAGVFERLAVATLEASDDLLRPVSPRSRWSTQPS